MKNNYALAITFHNPSDNELKTSIYNLSFFQNSFIIDNSSEKTDNQFTQKNLTYIKKDNIGLSKAYNLALKWAKQHEFTWLMILDQDSKLPKDFCVENVFSLFSKKELGNTAIINISYTSVKKLKIKNKITISSGSIINVEKALKINGFDERYFIDGVDFEFASRLIERNYTIWSTDLYRLSHNIGNTSKQTPTLNHSPIRYYYITRNYLMFHSDFDKSPKRLVRKRVKKSTTGLLKHISDIKHEPNKMEKIYFCLLGYRDFKSEAFHKLESFQTPSLALAESFLQSSKPSTNFEKKLLKKIKELYSIVSADKI